LVSIERTACLTVRKVPVRLMSTVRFQTSRSRSAALASCPNSWTPALATTTSGDQPESASSAKARSTVDSSEISKVWARAVPSPDSATIVRAACWAAPSSRAAITTRTPSRTKREATARPMPEAEPVIRAVRQDSRDMEGDPIYRRPRCEAVGTDRPFGRRASLRAQRITMEAGRGTRRRAEDSAEGHEPAQHHHGVTHTISEFAQPVDQFQGASTVIPAQEALYRQGTSA